MERKPLPVCRWRGREIEPDRYRCLSPKIRVGERGVSGDLCRGCSLADHPVPPEGCVQNPWGAIEELERQGIPVQITGGTPSPPQPQWGPGSELKALLDELGVKVPACGGCQQRMEQMDRWGPAGCREHKAEIVAALTAQQKAQGWGASLMAGVTAYRKGIWLNPLAPLESLVELAIQRAEAKAGMG